MEIRNALIPYAEAPSRGLRRKSAAKPAVRVVEATEILLPVEPVEPVTSLDPIHGRDRQAQRGLFIDILV